MPSEVTQCRVVSPDERNIKPMPGIRWGRISADLRICLVDEMPRSDILLPADAGRHVSLAMMLDGSGHFLMDGGAPCLYQPGWCYLSCAWERFGGIDYFPAYHRLKVVLLQYREDWLDALTPLLLEVQPGAQRYLHPARRACVTRMPMSPELRAFAQTLFDDGIPVRPLDLLKLESHALSVLWQVAHRLSGGAGGDEGAHGGPAAQADRLTGRERRLLVGARAYIDAHCLEPLEVATIGRAVGLGHHALKQGFQTLFGTGVYGYVLERRLEHAVKLLDESALPVKEIAWRCGFAHASHLARQFRQRYGVTPRAYRSR
ncbi:helix-turn-helix transcriptional regulator [Paraburkholderia hayleyella]|uniref:helix-turn-helix transcriptional regulator n=1 Tax=Paraburkholderia hayleyella TaxID=2152889 RepID=UPI0012917350|nr:AraC family transcriptional regulator [Paraburkholderia hayleyella]